MKATLFEVTVWSEDGRTCWGVGVAGWISDRHERWLFAIESGTKRLWVDVLWHHVCSVRIKTKIPPMRETTP